MSEETAFITYLGKTSESVFGTLRYNWHWPMSVHASQAFSTSIAPIHKIYHYLTHSYNKAGDKPSVLSK